MSSLLTWAVLLAAPQTPYNHGNLSDDEQLILEMINRARRSPTKEGLRLGININEGLSSAPSVAIPRPPLAANANLQVAAEAHADHMYLNDYLNHNYPVPPAAAALTPFIRMDNAGYDFAGAFAWGENIACGPAHTAAQLEDLLMVDQGPPPVANRAHRRNLLDIYATNVALPLREIGLCYVDKTADKANIDRYILVQDFAKSDTGGPFLVGVVINDADNDQFFDPTEGVNAIEIRIAGHVWKANTSASGGYAFPIAGLPLNSEISVLCSGGTFGVTGVIKKFWMTGQNVKLDFYTQDLVDTEGIPDGLPDYWEALNFTSGDPASDVDDDGATALQEYQYGSDPNVKASTPHDPLAVGGATTDPEGPEGCGTLGVEVLLVMAAGALLRRRRA